MNQRRVKATAKAVEGKNAMADLSDIDKQKLLGSDYKAQLMARDAASGVTDVTRSAKAKADQMSNIMMTAAGLGAVAALIFVTNLYSVSAPYNSTLAIGSALFAVACFGIAGVAFKSQHRD